MTATEDLARRVGEVALARGLTVGVAESLTGGSVATALAAAPDASEWFHGGVVAYAVGVKEDLLGVSPGPVVTERCARQMAAGAARALSVDAAVSTTGVGGPDPEEGQPPGTVYVAVVGPGGEDVRRLDLDGSPTEVVQEATATALGMLLSCLEGGS